MIFLPQSHTTIINPEILGPKTSFSISDLVRMSGDARCSGCSGVSVGGEEECLRSDMTRSLGGKGCGKFGGKVDPGCCNLRDREAGEIRENVPFG